MWFKSGGVKNNKAFCVFINDNDDFETYVMDQNSSCTDVAMKGNDPADASCNLEYFWIDGGYTDGYEVFD